MKFTNLALSALLLLSSHATFGAGNRRQGGDQIGFPGQTMPQPSHPGQGQQPWPGEDIGSNIGSHIGTHTPSIRDIELQVNDYFQGRNQLDLLQDFYIANQLRGQRIEDITIVAATEFGRGEAQLLLNRQAIERAQVVSQGLSSYTFRVDPFANVVGQSLRSIALDLQGRFFVQKVIFNLRQQDSWPDPFPGPFPTPRNEIIRQQVNQRIVEEGGLELFRLFGLGMSRQGQIIKRVTVSGRSARGFGTADLQVNGQMVGFPQRLSEYSDTVSFDLNPGLRIGQEIRSLQVHLRGMLTIDEVTIEIDNQSSRLPDRGQRRFEQMINQRLYDTNGIDLVRLARVPLHLENQIVDSVELTLRSADMGTKLALCQIQSGQFQRLDCGAQVFVSQGRQIVRLSPVSFARLRDVTLAVRMGMIDLDSIAINFR